jgi:hypothetical protein
VTGIAAVVDLHPIRLAGGHSFATDLIEIAGGNSVTHGGEESTIVLEDMDWQRLATDLVLVLTRENFEFAEREALRAALPPEYPVIFFPFDAEPALDPSSVIPSDLSFGYLSAELKSPVKIPILRQDDACRGYRTLRNQTFVRQKSCICTETEIFCTRPVFICGGGDLLHLGVTHRLALPGLTQLAISFPGLHTDARGLANGARGGHFYLNK